MADDDLRQRIDDAISWVDPYESVERVMSIFAAETQHLTAANADLTDRLDRTLHELREVAGERDRQEAAAIHWQARAETAELCDEGEQWCPRAAQMETERDAATAALLEHIDLLDGLRTKVTRLAEIAEGTADAFALEPGLAAETGRRVARSMAEGLRGALAPAEVQP